MEPIVSVIVPVYKAEKYLSACIDSLCGQTLGNIEIILVDDGSPDGSPAICDKYALSDSRVRVIHKENEGPGIARNTGLELARGEWICFVDSDDYIALNTLEIASTIGERTHADQVRYLFKRVPHDEEHTMVTVEIDTLDYNVLDTFPCRAVPLLEAVTDLDFGSGVKSSGSACTAIFRRSMLERNNLMFRPESEIVIEDYAYNLEVAPACGSIVYTPYQFYFYRNTPCSRSKYRPDRMSRAADFADYLKDTLPALGYSDVPVITTAVMLGSLRSFLREIYASDLSASGKRKAHYEAVNHPYLKKIEAEGLSRQFPLLQRVAFRCRGSYLMSRILTNGRDWVKKYFKI